jgi:hypothetical protein
LDAETQDAFAPAEQHHGFSLEDSDPLFVLVLRSSHSIASDPKIAATVATAATAAIAIAHNLNHGGAPILAMQSIDV